MITISGLTKRYGSVLAIEDVGFNVELGSIVGFVGRNGAGKTSTLKILVGLATADSGMTLVNNKPYRKLESPLRSVGIAFDPFAFHPGISGRRQVAAQALRAGIPSDRVDEVLNLVGLTAAANRRVKGYSLGMRQRLNLACAMLGDPEYLLLDEPTNGLDPQGHRWLRGFLRDRADEGKAVLFSSHVLTEVSETADRVIIIANGKVVADGTISDLVQGETVHLKSENQETLADTLAANGASIAREDGGVLVVREMSARTVGEIARDQGIALYELATVERTLEEVFVNVTGEQDTRPS